MEYIKTDGTKIIVDGDKIKYGNGPKRRNIIGANFANGIILGGYISSFDGSFEDEMIGIEIGMGDIVNAKIGDIKDAYKILKKKISSIDTNNIFELTSAVLETVDEYFGGFDNISDRMKYYYPEDFTESENNRMSDLKGTGAAMCTERAALSQNLLKSMGINSIFKTSGIIKNNKKEVHSYNLIEFNNTYYIYDSSMPCLIDGKISPLISKIDEETFSLLSAPISDIGISATVSHYNPYKDINITVTYDSGREKQIELTPLGINKAEKNKQFVKGSISLSTVIVAMLFIVIIMVTVVFLNLLLK